jgi:membrane protease YdiL (CAAX protease family)
LGFAFGRTGLATTPGVRLKSLLLPTRMAASAQARVKMGRETDTSVGCARRELKLAHPGFWMAVLMVLVGLGVQIVLAVPLGLIDLARELGLHQPRLHLERQPLIVGCVNLAAFGAAIALGLFLNRLSFRKAFPLRRITAAQGAAMVALLLGLGVLLSEVDNAFRALLPPPQWLLKFLEDVFFREHQLLSRVFLLVLVAPLTEELLFRGIILRGLLSRFRPGAAILLTALLFAAVHLNPWQFFSALLLGGAFGWFYLRTGSVALCVLAHAFTNALTIVFPALPWHVPGLTGDDLSLLEFQPWWLNLSGLAMLLAGIWAFRKATPGTPTDDMPAPPVITPSAGIAP